MKIPNGKRLAPISAALLPLALVPALWITGKRRPPAAPRAVAAPMRRPVLRLPADERMPDRVEQVVLAQKKRIMGRKKSLLYVRRVAMEIGPLVARALEQPSIQNDLRALAEEMGLTLPAYKEYFRRKQEADLLLESGGDPSARSVSNAIGVAQWLASTGRAQGLRVDAAASRRLTAKIAATELDLEALQAQVPEFTRAAPPGWKDPLLAKRRDGETAKRQSGEAAKQGNADANMAKTEPTTPAGEGSNSSPATAPATSPAPSEPAAGTAQPTDPPTGTTPTAVPPSDAQGAPDAPGPDALPAAPAPVPATSSAGSSPVATSPSGPAAPLKPPISQPAKRPVWSRDRWKGYRKWELRLLTAKRRQVDERYDPATAIAAQTRYLVRLARQYGTVDWALQAYHGGEGGVANTVGRYMGARRQSFTSTGGAIRGTLASRGGLITRLRPMLTYSDLYFGTTPRTHPEAFAYLYGRSDDHRYYWWKVLMAERAIGLYRRDPDEFQREWQALRPGQRLEAAWYPEPEKLSFRNVAALREAYASGTLTRVPADLRARGVELGNIAPLDPANAYHYKGLRPAAMGALLQIAAQYKAQGGNVPLRVLSLTQTKQYAALLTVRFPPPPRKEPLAPEEVPVDLHPSGLCFDLQRPAKGWNRKVLEYALGQLFDRGKIYWLIETERGPGRYHVCPSPAHAEKLAKSIRNWGSTVGGAPAALWRERQRATAVGRWREAPGAYPRSSPGWKPVRS